ncbi:phage tail assembly protein [Pseudomonas sp. A2]|uniref:phage tail assembly protein n=1 Tax=Pseudomonas sp. A2 TaxID=107445 RepID=UPI002B81646D|nr:phage tail assembly protein [Pseudomonas sp. A2]MEB3437897.1 phage tail assembly protein [Pseudomonas sp. A2]
MDTVDNNAENLESQGPGSGQTTVEVEASAAPADPNTVILDTPIKRGSHLLKEITLRKPASGELRGIHLSELLNMDVTSLIKLLPRITQLTAPEAAQLDPADLVAIGVKVTGFLLQKQTKTDASLLA